MENMNKEQNLQAWALYVLRMVIGITFVLHGGQKVMGWFGGPGLAGFVQWMGTLGIPSWLAYAAAYAEFVGGILLMFGIAAELGALLIMVDMIGAVLVFHGFSHGYFVQNGGFEYPLNLVFLAAAVIIGGPGKGALWDPFKNLRQ